MAGTAAASGSLLLAAISAGLPWAAAGIRGFSATGAEALKLEPWMEKYCELFKELKGKDAECKQHVEGEEQHCKQWKAELEKETSPVKQRTLRLNDKHRCDNYEAMRDKVKLDLQAPGQGMVRRAVEACEPEVLSVCEEASCPTYCRAMDIKKCDCKVMCASVTATMFHTGEMDCDPDKEDSWELCASALEQKLKMAGREQALEALTREHLVKCVCVARRPEGQDATCYAGGLGIEAGKRWCDFYKTPSWLKLKGIEVGKANWAKEPECNKNAYLAAQTAAQTKKAPSPSHGSRRSAPVAAALLAMLVGAVAAAGL